MLRQGFAAGSGMCGEAHFRSCIRSVGQGVESRGEGRGARGEGRGARASAHGVALRDGPADCRRGAGSATAGWPWWRSQPKVRRIRFSRSRLRRSYEKRVPSHGERDRRDCGCGGLRSDVIAGRNLRSRRRRARGRRGGARPSPLIPRPSKKREPADKPGSVVGSHSSRSCVAAGLERPTRERRGQRHGSPIRSCSRWGLPCRSVARLAVRSYRTVSPLPRMHRALRQRTHRSAVCSLLHFPSAFAAQALPGTLPCGARTFLGA